MKNRTNAILLAVFLLSLAAYAFLLLTDLDIVDWGFAWDEFRGCLALGFHAVPAFCLQLLLCRAVKRRWIAWVPALLLVLAVILCALGWTTATGWDSLGWAILLLLCIAPAVGLALAWAVYGFGRLHRRGNIRG